MIAAYEPTIVDWLFPALVMVAIIIGAMVGAYLGIACFFWGREREATQAGE